MLCKLLQRLRMVCLAAALLAIGGPSWAQWVAEPEPLKSAFLFNFALYTDWPADTPPAITFCHYGPDSLGPAFDKLAKKSINGKAILTQRITHPAQTRACQVLFIPESQSAQLSTIVNLLGQAPILTVTDAPQDGDLAMIQLTLTQGRMTFTVNLSRVQQAGLKLSSRLLKLAQELR